MKTPLGEKVEACATRGSERERVAERTERTFMVVVGVAAYFGEGGGVKGSVKGSIVLVV